MKKTCKNCIYSVVHKWHETRSELRCDQPMSDNYLSRVAPIGFCTRHRADGSQNGLKEILLPAVNGFGGSHVQ